jgi:riboflavin synthase
MFSGIVAAVGRITHLSARSDEKNTVRLTIEAGALGLDDVALGDSIACNGVCLTVVEIEGNHFRVDVSPETLSCTVGLEAPGAINLEKALRVSDRLGGHIVSGHVDASMPSATTDCCRSARRRHWRSTSPARARSR